MRRRAEVPNANPDGQIVPNAIRMFGSCLLPHREHARALPGQALPYHLAITCGNEERNRLMQPGVDPGVNTEQGRAGGILH